MSQPLEVTDPADAKEAAEWAKAGKYMLTGGAEAESDEAGEEQPEVREFRYRGKTVKVDPETHELLESLKNEARSGNGRIGSELARTRERLARMEAIINTRENPTETLPDIFPEPDALLATKDITEWQRQMKLHNESVRERDKQELRREYEQARAAEAAQANEAARTKAWADRFYSSYDHFDDPLLKKVVTDAYLDHRAEIDSYGPEAEEEAHARLAELADQRLVRLRKAGKLADPDQTNPNDNRRRVPTFESSARATARKPDDSARSRERAEFSAASWVAKERLRMSGRTPRPER